MKMYSLCALKFPLVLGLLALAPHGFAAGFDCGKASSSVEKMICATPAVSAQDDTLGRLYKWRLEEASIANKPGITAAQKSWIAQKRDTCSTSDCLSSAYEARIVELAAIKFNGGSATYVGEAAEVARITKQIQQDLRKVGITQPLGTCSHVLSLDSHPKSYGAFCDLGKQKPVEICDENMAGNLAVNFYGFEQTSAGLAAFTQAVCPGG